MAVKHALFVFVVVQIDVPLIYYFLPAKRDSDSDDAAKSFIYEIRPDPKDPSRELMEILVNAGRDVTSRDLRLDVNDKRQLIVFADVRSRSTASGFDRKVIKRYTLPPLADVDGISSKLGRDGRLKIIVPLFKK